ncbi:MAG: hypothetical protein COC15_03905 [Legionellales bacterium]|nr:MAG: hypothetical protein COC15_03905 [Legionellales bacterium]
MTDNLLTKKKYLRECNTLRKEFYFSTKLACNTSNIQTWWREPTASKTYDNYMLYLARMEQIDIKASYNKLIKLNEYYVKLFKSSTPDENAKTTLITMKFLKDQLNKELNSKTYENSIKNIKKKIRRTVRDLNIQKLDNNNILNSELILGFINNTVENNITLRNYLRYLKNEKKIDIEVTMLNELTLHENIEAKLKPASVYIKNAIRIYGEIAAQEAYIDPILRAWTQTAARLVKNSSTQDKLLSSIKTTSQTSIEKLQEIQGCLTRITIRLSDLNDRSFEKDYYQEAKTLQQQYQLRCKKYINKISHAVEMALDWKENTLSITEKSIKKIQEVFNREILEISKELPTVKKLLPKKINKQTTPKQKIEIIFINDYRNAQGGDWWQQQYNGMKQKIKDLQGNNQYIDWKISEQDKGNAEDKYTISNKEKVITVARDKHNPNKIKISADANQVANDRCMLRILLAQAIQKAGRLQIKNIKVTGANHELFVKLQEALEIMCKNTAKFTLVGRKKAITSAFTNSRTKAQIEQAVQFSSNMPITT